MQNLRATRVWMVCLIGVSLLALSGCSSSSETIRRAREEAILRVDRAFERAAVQHGLRQAYAHYFLPNAVLLANETHPIRGRHMILERLPEGSSSPLTWLPQEALSSAHGRLGVSWGYYEVSGKTPKGQPEAAYGSYVTLWKRVHGHWRVSLEMQNATRAPGAHGSHPVHVPEHPATS